MQVMQSRPLWYLLIGLSYVYAKRSKMVVIDAGSTGTRAHLFLVDAKINSNTGLISEISFVKHIKYKNGEALSKFASNPDRVKSVVGKLVKALKADTTHIPAKEHGQTMIALRATAGVRALDKRKQAKVLKAASEVLKKSGFLTLNPAAQILSGVYEGFYLWFTCNFALGRLTGLNSQIAGASRRQTKRNLVASQEIKTHGNSSKTAIVLELGGGSTQITYRAHERSAATRKFKVFDRYMHINVHSFKLGIQAARAKFVDGEGGERTSICINPKESIKYAFQEESYTIKGKQATKRHFKCMNKAKDLTQSLRSKFNWRTKKLPLIIASSAFFYIVRAAATNPKYPSSKKETVYTATISWLDIAAHKKCKYPPGKSNHKYLRYAQYLCIDLVYIVSLFRDGYGFSSYQKIHFVKDINKVPLEWATGFALQNLYEYSIPKKTKAK